MESKLIKSWKTMIGSSHQNINSRRALKEGGMEKKSKNEKHSQTIKTDEFYMLVHDEKKKKGSLNQSHSSLFSDLTSFFFMMRTFPPSTGHAP